MADIDYAPVTSPEDEEEQRRRLYDSPYPPAELGSPSPFQEYGGDSSAHDASLAVSPSTAPAAPAGPPPVTGDSYLSDQYKAGTVGEPAMSPARTRLKALTDQGAPAVEPLHGWKKVADIAGKYWAPGVEQSIRYAPQHEYQANLKQAEGDVAGENVGPTEDAALREKNAKAQQEESRAESLKHPQVKPTHPDNPEAAAYETLTDPNASPDEKKRAEEAITKIKGAGKNNETHTAEDIRAKIHQAYEAGNPAEVARLQKELKAVGDPFAQQKVNIQVESAADKHDAAKDKKTESIRKQSQPYQAILDEADSAHNLQGMADKGNAAADVDLALSFFKVMRSGGQGIRFTQQEQNLILGARNSAGDLQAMAQKVVGSGQKFTPEQRQQIVAVIDMHAKAAKSAMARISGEPTSEPTNSPADGELKPPGEAEAGKIWQHRTVNGKVEWRQVQKK